MLPLASSWILMLDFLFRLSGSLDPSNKSRISSLYSCQKEKERTHISSSYNSYTTTRTDIKYLIGILFSDSSVAYSHTGQTNGLLDANERQRSQSSAESSAVPTYCQTRAHAHTHTRTHTHICLPSTEITL